MAASDSYPHIIRRVVTALGAAGLIRSLVARKASPAPQGEGIPRSIPPVATSGLSERQLLWNTLSTREEQIARLAARDWTDDEIARQLNLSVRTVQNHLQHAREKLHIHSRHELKYYLPHLGPPQTAVAR